MKSSKGIQKNIKDIAPFFHLTEMEGFSNRINHSFKFVKFVTFSSAAKGLFSLRYNGACQCVEV